MIVTPHLNGLTALGTSAAYKNNFQGDDHVLEIWLDQRAVAASKITACTVEVQASINDPGIIGVVNKESAGLAVGSTAERFANGAFTYRIADTNYNLAADAVGAQFTSAHVVTASKFGVINVYVDAAGTLLTLSAKLGDDQTAALAADTAEAAFAIADGIPLPAAHCYVGRILIEADAGGWTANTDDLTDGSDLTTASFFNAVVPYVTVYEAVLDSSDIAAGRYIEQLYSDAYFPYIRLFLSVLTGTGKVYANIVPVRRSKK